MLAVEKLPQIDIQAVRTKLVQALAGTTTQSEICRETGIGRTSMSQFINEKYPGDNDAMAKKINQWLRQRDKEKEINTTLPSAPDYVPTQTSERIISAFMYAHAVKDIAVIYGGAGNQKTTSIAHYANSNNNVWVIEATPSRKTGGALLRAIAYTIGQRLPKGHVDYLENLLLDKLKGTNGMLIIDEAQFLNDGALENARRLAEMAGIGLALVGNEVIYTQLTGRNRKAEFAQLFSRIGKRVRIHKPTDKDIEMICKEWGLGKDEIALAKEIASKPGALRGLTKTLRLATMFANGQPINAGTIKLAWKDLTAGED